MRASGTADWDLSHVVWSPDGTRVAVRTERHITEISSDYGGVIAQHPQTSGWLIWPASDQR